MSEINNVKDRIARFREWLRSERMTAVIIPMSDAHGSEYVGESDRWIYYLTGFSGSAATVVIFEDGRSYLLTDGRYHIQAGQELSGTGVQLIRSGLEGEPGLDELIISERGTRNRIAVPSELVSEREWASCEKKLENRAADSGGKLILPDLIGIDLNELAPVLWPDRPARKASAGWLLPESITGSKLESRIRAVRKKTEAAGAGAYIVTALDAIAWLFDLRGDDIACTPVLYAGLILQRESGGLYLQPESAKTLPESFGDRLRELGIRICEYTDFNRDAADLNGTVAIDQSAVNHRIVCLLDKAQPVYVDNAYMIPQSVKNITQIGMMQKAHFLDGLALTKLIYLIKTGKADLKTEWDVAYELEKIKTEAVTYIGPSFPTIAAAGPNAAICHYTPDQEHCSRLGDRGFLLLDCGGQYTQGTTDVTRTIALGELTCEEKRYYTAVLKGHVRLAHAPVDPQTPTMRLDELARGPLKELGADYLHGTGHGVGFVLSVHEGPVRILAPHHNASEDTPLKLGNVVSDEPGYYREGAFGIRVENLLVLRRTAGRRFYFETLTLAPYEPDAILTDQLSDDDIAWINRYHGNVYRKLSPYLTDEEAAWLKEQTKPL